MKVIIQLNITIKCNVLQCHVDLSWRDPLVVKLIRPLVYVHGELLCRLHGSFASLVHRTMPRGAHLLCVKSCFRLNSATANQKSLTDRLQISSVHFPTKKNHLIAAAEKYLLRVHTSFLSIISTNLSYIWLLSITPLGGLPPYPSLFRYMRGELKLLQCFIERLHLSPLEYLKKSPIPPCPYAAYCNICFCLRFLM
jgi:hypothetical protein